jgi:hypothetical protein
VKNANVKKKSTICFASKELQAWKLEKDYES